MVFIIKALLFSSLLIVITEACQDTDPNCKRYLSYCNQSNGWMEVKCRKTCGYCDDGKTTTTTTTTTTTAAPKGNCVDNDNDCAKWKRYCAKSGYMKRECKRTCGFCTGGGKTTTTTTTKAPKTTTTTTQKPKTTTTTTQAPKATTTTKRPTTTTTATTTTTKKPTTTTKKTTTTTTKKPTTTTTATTTTTKKPTTTTVTTTTTKRPVNPPSGGCGDKEPFCFMSMFNKSQHCGKYGHICIKSCGRCNGPDNQKCSNLKDRAPNSFCGNKKCQASNPLDKHRAHVKCARTCCDKDQLN